MSEATKAREQRLEASRRYRAALKKKGRCLICRKAAKAGKSRCPACLKANAAGTRKWYRTVKASKKSRR